jgi:hypothetical protein
MAHAETFVTAFDGARRLAAGRLRTVAPAVAAATRAGAAGPLLVFEDATGRVVDIDLRGSDAEIVGRLPAPPALATPNEAPRGRGRPKLGVVAREVTLLPRHWDWLSAQPGGASVALRRLVDAARKTGDGDRRRRSAQEAAYRFMSAMAGDLAHYEEAARALFADDAARFAELTAGWPADIRDHARSLAFGRGKGGEDG